MSEPIFSNRYEIKYLVETRRLPEIQEALSDFFEPDVHAHGDGGYYNYSIYFDSPHYEYYSEKVEGQLTRLKPRLRLYLDSPEAQPSAYFLELKGRHDRIVLKRRERISQGFAQSILSNGPIDATAAELESSTIGEFFYLMNRRNLQPRVTVLYRRLPFNATFYPHVRVTFDTLVQCSFKTALNNPPHAFGAAVPFNWFILELKYNDKIPQLLMNRMNALELRQRSISKYAVSLEKCYQSLNNGHSME